MNSEFINKQVNFKELPTLESIVFESLNNKYRKVVLFRSILILTILIIVAFFIMFSEIEEFENNSKLVVSISIVFFGILYCVLQWLGVNKKGYAVRTHDIIYKSGLINQTETIIPFNRVQHIETYEGAILRLFGLCQLEFFTAGGSFGNLRIPGLTKANAEQIKAFVVSKVKPLEEKKDAINEAEKLENTINE